MFKTKQKLKNEVLESEKRAINHFKKLIQIEQIINESNKNKEMYLITIEKIKKIIQ